MFSCGAGGGEEALVKMERLRIDFSFSQRFCSIFFDASVFQSTSEMLVQATVPLAFGVRCMQMYFIGIKPRQAQGLSRRTCSTRIVTVP